MVQTDYYYSLGKQWFYDLAKSLTDATGYTITVTNNDLIFPNALGTGKFELIEPAPGIFVILINCRFYEKVVLHRPGTKASDYSTTFVNLNNAKIIIKQPEGPIIQTGNDFSQAFVLGSCSATTDIIFPVGEKIKAVKIIYHRAWLQKQMQSNQLTFNNRVIGKILAEKPLRIAMSLDLKSKLLLEEMIEGFRLNYAGNVYVEGCCIQLIWLFINNYNNGCEIGNENTKSELERIKSLKKQIEAGIDDTIPSLSEAAIKCLMSKSKFARVFKTMYGDTYTTFFLKLKMEYAKELLKQGFSVTYISNKIGYLSSGQFSKLFKRYIGTAPQKYKMNSKEGSIQIVL